VQGADASFFNYTYDPVSGNGTLTYDDGSGIQNLTAVGAAHFNENCEIQTVNLVGTANVVSQDICDVVFELNFSARDSCNNTTIAAEYHTQVVTIEDNEGPTFTSFPPDDATLECMPDTSFYMSFVTAIDNCAGTNCISNLTFTSTDVVVQAGTACLGDPRVTERTFRVEDGCGNFSEFVQTITEIDEEAPTFTPPADETFYYDENCSVNIGTTEPTNISDNCGVPTVSSSTIFGSDPFIREFILHRTWNITDL